MAFNVEIRANVVDIRSGNDIPKSSDKFIIDTNVWYWMTYTKASLPGIARPYQIYEYPSYMNAALDEGAGLKYTGLNIVELTHIIERAEKDIFSSGMSLKQFRHENPDQRSLTCQEIIAACKQVSSMAEIIEISLDSPTLDIALKNISNCQVDGYDLLISNAMLGGDIKQVVTDDADFASIDGITVFTANGNLIRSANSCGKLVKR